MGEPADELQGLRDVWQSAAPAGLTVDIDADELRRRLRRRRNQLRFMMTADVLATVAVLVLVMLELRALPSLEWVAWGLSVSVLALAALVGAMLIRRPAWSIDLDAGAAELVASSTRQVRAALGIARLTYVVVVVAFVLLACWGWFDFASLEAPTAHDLRRRFLAYGFAVLYGLSFLVVAMVCARRRRRELARWQDTAASLDAAGAGTVS
jgi:hypothetical protein